MHDGPRTQDLYSLLLRLSAYSNWLRHRSVSLAIAWVSCFISFRFHFVPFSFLKQSPAFSCSCRIFVSFSISLTNTSLFARVVLRSVCCYVCLFDTYHFTPPTPLITKKLVPWVSVDIYSKPLDKLNYSTSHSCCLLMDVLCCNTWRVNISRIRYFSALSSTEPRKGHVEKLLRAHVNWINVYNTPWSSMVGQQQLLIWRGQAAMPPASLSPDKNCSWSVNWRATDLSPKCTRMHQIAYYNSQIFGHPNTGGSNLRTRGKEAVAALAIDKVGPRPYHFRSGPTSGPTTRPGSQKK